VFVVRGRYSPVPIESDRKGLDALVAACKEGGISGAVGGGGGSTADENMRDWVTAVSGCDVWCGEGGLWNEA
jgi:hypothetical protein